MEINRLFFLNVIPEDRNKTEHQLTDDGHEGVKVADVEALASHVDEELDDPSSVFLFHGLRRKMEDLLIKYSGYFNTSPKLFF